MPETFCLKRGSNPYGPKKVLEITDQAFETQQMSSWGTWNHHYDMTTVSLILLQAHKLQIFWQKNAKTKQDGGRLHKLEGHAR